MILDKFNDRLNSIRLDSALGKGLIFKKGSDKVSGIGDIVEEDTVALFSQDKTLWLLIKGTLFNVSENDISINYSHNGQDITIVSVIENGKEVLKYRYPSWWVRCQEPMPAGVGQGFDEEEDFVAYVKLMISADNRKEHLLEKYS